MKKTLITLTVTVALTGCGSDAAPGGDTPDGLPQCDSGGYVAFDAANHGSQDLRVGAYTQIVAVTDAVKNDISLAATNFGNARTLYETTAELSAKVAGRTDDHLPAKPVAGADMHAVIDAWLTRGAATSSVREARVAKQFIDKTLVGFFFLSVYHEMALGERAKWDEAFGYWGSGATNEEGGRQAMALVAEKRDIGNGTNLAQTVFNGIVDGSCALGTVLEEEGIDSVDPSTVPAVWSVVQEVDADMQRVLAYSAGHEAREMVELLDGGVLTGEETEMWVKLAELDPYFRPLERLMLAKGGTSQTRAEAIRAEIGAADFADLDNVAWMAGFDAAAILTAIEAEFGIDVLD
jgi:hypothetical protein